MLHMKKSRALCTPSQTKGDACRTEIPLGSRHLRRGPHDGPSALMLIREMDRSIFVLNVTVQSSGRPFLVDENAICRESGDQLGASFTPLVLVSRAGFEPSAPMTYISNPSPEEEDTKAIIFPSGDQAGSYAAPP